MRFCSSIFCLMFCLTTAYSASAQTQTPTSFQQQAQAAVSAGKLFSVVNLTATAEWIAGSDHETGTAQLQANADGSTNVQLILGKASRTEVQTKADSSRTCTWTDSAGKNYDVRGPNCFIAIPWFAPSIFMQSQTRLSPLLNATDEGETSENNVTHHQIKYVFNHPGAYNLPTAKHGVNVSTVKVSCDPQTFLPSSLEYQIHPDNNNLQNIGVRVVFSNYQSVSGVMLPFHIEKYVNRSLQLSLDVTNASIE
jgi:hypothetical protein